MLPPKQSNLSTTTLLGVSDIVTIDPVNTPYQHKPSTHPINPLCQHTLLTHPINPPYPHRPSTHPLNLSFSPVHPLYPRCQAILRGETVIDPAVSVVEVEVVVGHFPMSPPCLVEAVRVV